jgi:GT2 family glycosyltransferase
MSERLAVILVNYRNPEDTILCLESLAAAAEPEVLILVVENGSADGSAGILAAHLEKSPLKSRLLPSEKNLGFSGGCNLGIRFALENGITDVLLLNNDTTVPPDFFRALLKAREEHPGAILTGALLEAESGRPGYSIGRISRRSLVVRHMLTLPPGPYQTVDFASGGLMLIPAQVLRDVGTLRDEFFMYCEDLEFCLRAGSLGIPIVYASAVSARHKTGSSSLKSRLPRVYYGFRNQTRIVWERGNPANRIFYLLFLFTQVPGLLRRPHIIGQFVRGIRDGIRGRLGRI